MEDFQYVVERQDPQRICFGSSLQRNTNPIGAGLSSFQKRYAHELFIKLTPQTYNIGDITSAIAPLQNKVRSIRGVATLANKASRFTFLQDKRVPSPTRYDPEPLWKTFKQSKLPFDKCIPRKPKKRLALPGVGTYNVRTHHCTRTKVAYNFGRPETIPTVEIDCNPTPADICDRCGSICDNDYWHIDDTSFLCHMCMEEEKILREDFTIAELKQYEKKRICTKIHIHEGAKAAIRKYPPHKIRKLLRLENYLNLFIPSV